MVFSSYIFLYLFLPAALVLYYLSPRSWKALTLTLASYVFYGWWRPDFMGLMLFSTFVDFVCGKKIHASEGKRRKCWLLLSLCMNLGLLGYFKYMNFGVETLNQLLAAAGFGAVSWPTVVLPVGISFYTFQTMSYSIDIYRGISKPQERLVDFACYVALFPQLVAGPIVRYNTLADQLRRRAHTLGKFSLGVLYFQLGFAKKVLLADSVAPLADTLFGRTEAGLATSAVEAWLGTLAYTFQIYFDFSGYSDMAIGLGMMFGFVYPPNFDAPYKSRSITEFWRRWHISLSTWLRDYLYIPLGGNRNGPVRTYVNLSLTMLLGGLWHGASWNFVIWGAYQGFWLILERLLGKKSFYAALPDLLRLALTFVIAMIGWVFFRAETLPGALNHLGAMFGITSEGSTLEHVDLRTLPLAALLAAWTLAWFSPTTQDWLKKPGTIKVVLALIGFACALAHLHFSSYSPFLYFRF